MIIDKNFDKALWLILNADSENSEKVVNFICSIPNELIEQIREKIIILNKYKDTDEKKIMFLCGEYVTNDNKLYWFEIDSYFKEIDLGYKRYNGMVYEDVFEMSLSLDDNLFNIKKFSKKNIGRIEYDINNKNIDNICNIVESSENTYDLFKTLLGYIIIYSKDDDKKVRNYFKIIDILDIPEELYLDDIKDNNLENRLVRRKRK